MFIEHFFRTLVHGLMSTIIGANRSSRTIVLVHCYRTVLSIETWAIILGLLFLMSNRKILIY